MAVPSMFCVVIFSELYLLTKYSCKKCENYLVVIRGSTTFASAFRKEEHIRAIFEQISYRQVVRRACSFFRVCPRVIRTVNLETLDKEIETDLSKKRQTGASKKMRALCTFFYGHTSNTVKFTKKSLILAQDER